MNFRMPVLALLLLAWLLQPSSLLPRRQEEVPLRLRLSREVGLSLGSLMQGNFSIRITGPEDLVRIQFLLDGEPIGEDNEPPFGLRVNTADYKVGSHRFSAIGFRVDGSQLLSNTVTRQFVSSRIVTWVVAAFLALVIAFRVGRTFASRQASPSDGRKRGYGPLGGAVCPNCGRPFGRHWWGINLIAGRLERCPHCRKWNLVQRASHDALLAAEKFAAELEGEMQSPSDVVESEDERLRRQLEESRFDEL